MQPESLLGILTEERKRKSPDAALSQKSSLEMGTFYNGSPVAHLSLTQQQSTIEGFGVDSERSPTEAGKTATFEKWSIIDIQLAGSHLSPTGLRSVREQLATASRLKVARSLNDRSGKAHGRPRNYRIDYPTQSSDFSCQSSPSRQDLSSTASRHIRVKELSLQRLCGLCCDRGYGTMCTDVCSRFFPPWYYSC